MKVKRAIYFVFGATFLSLGAIGVVLPLLPTTPFVILAALCFGKSSERAEKWILSNKYFGTYIEESFYKLNLNIY
ncbi:MAG: YbaN family protein [Methanobrevibacter sp. CfCl-M3]